MVEMPGIEPGSTAVVIRLLRVYPMKSFYSAPTLCIGNDVDGPSLSESPRTPSGETIEQAL